MKRIVFIGCFVFIGIIANSKIPKIVLIVKKQGVYFGLEQGSYDFLEFGSDYQRKKIVGLRSIKINAFHYGFSYSIPLKTAGYSLGYYKKKGLVGLTYGVDLSGKTNFKNIQPAIAPVVGYKLVGFHIQLGYNFIYPTKFEIPINKYFIRLRFTLNQHTEWKKVKKKKAG